MAIRGPPGPLEWPKQSSMCAHSLKWVLKPSRGMWKTQEPHVFCFYRGMRKTQGPHCFMCEAANARTARIDQATVPTLGRWRSPSFLGSLCNPPVPWKSPIFLIFLCKPPPQGTLEKSRFLVFEPPPLGTLYFFTTGSGRKEGSVGSACRQKMLFVFFL